MTIDRSVTVSILIPARNEEQFISECLESIFHNDFPRKDYEILLIDGMSSDRTVEIATALCPPDGSLRVLRNVKGSIPAALNIGISAARGRIVIRMDAHAAYSKDYIQRSVHLLENSGADNVGGVVKSISKSTSIVGTTIAAVLSDSAAVGDSRFRVGAGGPAFVDTVFGGCYKTATLKNLGGYDEGVLYSEDYLMNLRLRRSGGRILLDPQIVCTYYPRVTIAAFLRQTARNGFWTILPLSIVTDYRPAPRHLAPLCFVLALVGLTGVDILWGNGLPVTSLALLAIYGIYVGSFGLKIGARLGIKYFFSSMVVLGLLHLVYGLGSLAGCFSLGAQFFTGPRAVSAKIRLSFMTKRLFDVMCSVAGLLICSPLLMVVAIAIKLGSRGPLFYRGARVGRHGKPFLILKFRTMVVNADKIGGPSTSADDPRVTPIGSLLRRYKLDELPQLINVLVGDMSLVGPRPEVPSEVAGYDENAKRLLLVRPGITDYSSIRFRNEGEILRGHADPHKAYKELIQPEKIRLGLKYVDERSLWLDVKLIFMTLGSLAR